MARGRRFVTALALLLAAGSFAAAMPEIEIVPERPRPGEVIFLTFRPEAELLRASCSWGGRNYRFLASAEVYALALPIPAGTRPGEHRATIYWKYITGEMGKRTLLVEVLPRKFGIQRLAIMCSAIYQYHR